MKTAAQAGSPIELIKDWLEKAGGEVSRLTGGGRSQLVFRRGHLVSVNVPNPDMSEHIGLRLSGYKGEITLEHELGGDVSLIDSMDFSAWQNYTPEGLAKWAVANTKGRQQLTIDYAPFGKKRRANAELIADRWLESGATGPYVDSLIDGMKVTQVDTDNSRSSARMKGSGLLIKWGLDLPKSMRATQARKWVKWAQRQLAKKQVRVQRKKDENWTRTNLDGYSVYDLEGKEMVAAMLAKVERDVRPLLKEFGLSYVKMTESVAEGSLGFNRGRRTIALNIRQKQDPMKLRKYSAVMRTMIHELAHLRHMDHSMKFKLFDEELLARARILRVYVPG